MGRVDAGMLGFVEVNAKRLLPRGPFELDKHSVEAVAGVRVRPVEALHCRSAEVVDLQMDLAPLHFAYSFN